MAQPVRFEFICQDLPKDTFAVNRLSGHEALSQLYRFDIELRSRQTEIDLRMMLSQNVRLSLWIDGEERRVHGILSDCQMLQQIGDYALFRVVLVPRLWQLSLYQANEVFLGKTVPQTLSQVLEEAGFTPLDYELILARNYRHWPYRCQYGETHLDFLQRLMEREGIYYFFEQGESSEKLIITDHLQFHWDMPNAKVFYDPVSGLEGEQFGNSLQSLVCHQKRVARQVVLRDYNDESPSVDIKGQATVDTMGMGEVNVFGLNIISTEEGRELAEIRAEQLRSTAEVFYGESTVQRLMSGYTLKLERHFRNTFNRSYLVTSVSHTGVDPSLSTLGSTAENQTAVEAYKNSFTAIPADVQFRPEPITSKVQIHGNLDAVIDAEGDGQYAEVDKEGRYKVVLPFDRQLRAEGKASHWIRMSQALAGEREGMHFPLRKGTHVLLSFIGGDPDRPIITGAMPNAAHPSVVTADNQTKSKIQTRAGNFIEMEDREDSKRIKLYSPHENTYMHLGAHNAPGDGIVMVSEGLHRQEIGGGSKATLVSKAKLRAWASENSPALITGASDELFNEAELFQFKKMTDTGHSTGTLSQEEENAGDYHISRRVGDYHGWKDGNDYNYGNGKKFDFGNSHEEWHINEDGIDNGETFDFPTSLGGAHAYDTDSSYVTKRWGDDINYQSGNSYSWRDGSQYVFGGRYVETHISGRTDQLNSTSWSHDICSPPTATGGSATIQGSKVILDPQTTTVDKMLGGQYSYMNGDTLKVIVGHSEQQTYGNIYQTRHGGRQEDTVYITYAGAEVMVSRTVSFDDQELQWNYHPQAGALSSFSASAQCGHVNFETKLMPTFDTSIDVSSLSFGMEIGINSFNINLTGCEFNLELQPFKAEISLDGFEIKLPGFEYSTEALELNTRLTELRTAMAAIKTKVTDVNATQATIGTGIVDLQTAVIKMFA